MEGSNLTQGNLSKNMRKLLIPLIFTNILNSIYTIVDGIWVGNLIGDVGVATVTNSFPIISIIVSISTGLAVGTSVLISQYYGAKNLEKVKSISGVSYILTAIIGVLSTVILMLLSETLLKITHIPNEILVQAKQYIFIYLIGYMFYFIFDLIIQSLRAIGDSKNPMKLVIVMTTMNMILDPILIKIGLGTFGAGLATAISLIFGTIVAIIYVNKKSDLLKFDLKRIKIKKEYVTEILKVAFPVALQEFIFSLVYFIELDLVNQMGVIGTAAYGVVEKIATIIYIIGTSFQTLMTVTIGQFIGDNKIDSTKEVIKNALKLAIIPFILSAIALYVFPRESCRIFVSSTEVIDAAMKYMSIISIIILLIPIRGILTGFIIGTGHTKFVVFSMLCAQGTEILVLYILRNSSIDILTKAGIAVTAFWIVKMMLELIYCFSGRWKKNVITEEGVI